MYDGGGIDPDIVVETGEMSSLTQVLYNNGLIFDYATLYASEHPTIGNARDFRLTDKEYEGFVTWVKAKQYNYRSPIEMELSLLKEKAKRERYYEDLRPQLENLTELLKESRRNDLLNFKDEIKMLLESDIVSRYHLERGAVEVNFQYDTELRNSIEVLNDSTRYKKILNIH